ncbi:MAG: glycosyl transferase family 2 [Candidatus Blackburnbacteria bacterium RIFCSPHIGHO2_01_FULL_44_64]|uniref:Glycosyl transferase family 2 n=1 Tax=Candidatus Blackburnbacteria bacterium RIFCSPHIGHO2_02_FULL_44_20 TaxID=1797516 RepID=A0A1G1V9H2_9BACT|nr:MAG: glycosyl transferase family 2 [Candidatus Blackburnbacteria bacterium RIFCSPHIGHO2_01_FULL_44_64]OGY10165.1 MAG: glycosyl transferase family 2 [Candidatus Blackburnbacteria bacterium RIFCSPHIGHO2_12_FULL_44_25]OGY12013.1 MAG: glycosyl transferase family 2 [Candidatus Blackburnbacteria bacterium RIFCSPHIGHO2_02_FULL_44_20]OGY14537.1 MAG: glycosyl transferase family 2 [Candidatus Blackburnbacteria bacterium RIFCSPLOWO2_01_FULL_44_43]OGY17454.1 MAG: glycosyl transferase family 2 [Candidatu
MAKTLNIVVPLAGAGTSFIKAGYSFPKPLIDINGSPMIQAVIENLKPKLGHKFILICRQEHYEKFGLYQIFSNATSNNYECVQLTTPTKGAACTVLTAVDFINNDNELLIANADQLVDTKVDAFIRFARKNKLDGAIMTFESNHPRWSYALADKKGNVMQVAEKRVISDNATVGLYYFKTGKSFVEAAGSMIEKDVKVNDEFFVSPVYNELILSNKKIMIYPIDKEKMRSLGTPEDLREFLEK